ncbi:MFS DHA1 amino acid exporter [Hysterangium stoloniferum]|nr:MFS DHA1 amino acid exporter [Hysterangium stoloniferum]
MAERAPLLDEHAYSTQSQADKVYDRFTPTHKRLITCLVAMSGVMETIVLGSFLPCVPAVAKDFNTTGVAINNVIGLAKIVVVIGILITAPYASFYGRRPLYLVSLPNTFIGGLICASASNVTQLLIGRGFQSIGAACISPIGANVISDLYKLEERGTAIGIFYGATQFGHLLAPVLGALINFVIVVLFLPETSHPGMRGIEKIRMAENLRQDPSVQGDRTGWRFILLNPLRIFLLLKNSILVIVSLTVSFAAVGYHGVMTPLSYTLGPRYGMTSPSLIGLCFLPAGFGDIAGPLIAGRLADITIIRGRRRRQGKWFPEDRLLAAIPSLLFLMPCAVITLGLSIAFIPGKVGLTISLICLFFNAMGAHVRHILSICFLRKAQNFWQS